MRAGVRFILFRYAAAMRTLLLAPLLMLACSSQTTTPAPTTSPTTDAAPEAIAPRAPKVHRATAVSCPTTRDPGHVELADSAANKCTTDAECTAGKNGRCWGGLQPASCSYDECVVDADCGRAVCDCRNVGARGMPNKCFRGTCRTDADCDGGKGYCSPSATNLESGCVGPALGAYGYFCHVAADECVDDEDCGTPIKQCLFDADVVHWRCTQVACPG